MAYTSTEDYYKQYKKQNKANKDKALEDLKAQGVVNEALINKEADEALETAEKTFTEKAMSAEEEVGLLREKNAINRALNERYINERMANLGLSNSGYAKASMMGAEAGYQNTAKGINEAEQKSLDTLAAALRESKTETEDWRAQEIAKNTANIDAETLKIENQYEKDAEKYAKDMVEQDEKAFEKGQEISENYFKKVEVDGEEKDYWNDTQKSYYVQSYADKHGLDRALTELPANIAYPELTNGWSGRDWQEYMRSFSKRYGVIEARAEFDLNKSYIPSEYRDIVEAVIRTRPYGG